MKKQIFIALLGIGTTLQAQTVLEFGYNNLGYQTSRKPASNGRVAQETASLTDTETLQERIENSFTVTPNPTSDIASLSWLPWIAEQVDHIELVSMLSSQRSPVQMGKGNSIDIQLRGKVAGMYMVVFHLNNKEVPVVQKKIIKL